MFRLRNSNLFEFLGIDINKIGKESNNPGKGHGYDARKEAGRNLGFGFLFHHLEKIERRRLVLLSDLYHLITRFGRNAVSGKFLNGG